MDPFSLSTGIAGLVDLAISTGKTVWKLQASFKGASKSLSQLADEVAAISSALSILQSRVERMRLASPQVPLNTGIVAALEMPLERCKETLKEIQKQFEGDVSFRRKLSWAFKDEEKVDGFIRNLALDKMHFTMVLQLDIAAHIDGMKTSVESIREESSISRAELKEEYQAIKDEREKERLAKEKRTQDSGKRLVINWLEPLDFTEKLDSSLSQRQPKTCMWLVNGNEIQSWKAAPGSCLWLHGIPGSGKTVLASALIESLLATKADDECLVYAYCDFRQMESRDSARILGTILARLLQNFRGDFSSEFDDLVRMQREGHKPPRAIPRLVELIKKAARHFGRTRIVIDALDESSDREKLLEAIQLLREDDRISLFLTSRKELDISESLWNVPSISLIDDQGRNVQNDINYHIEQEISNRAKLRNLPPALKRTLFVKLSAKANGMFRWVQCQLDFIATRKTFKSVLDALDDLPIGLFPTYERILLGIEKGGDETSTIAKRALRWVLGARRALHLSEIAEAIMIERNEIRLNEDLRVLSPDIILEVCSSLLIYNSLTDTVTLSHFSVQEYLFSKHLEATSLADYYYISSERVQVDVSILLMTYIAIEDFRREPCSSFKQVQGLREEHPFLRYAASNWFEHLRSIQTPNDSLFQLLLEHTIDRSGCPSHRFIQQIAEDLTESTFSSYYFSYFHPLYYFFSAGRPMWLIKRLLEARPSVANQIFSPQLGNPLTVAARTFNYGMVHLLLSRGAEIEQVISFEGRTRHSLFHAIECGNYDVAKVLVDRGVDINATMPAGWTLLHQAAASGSLRFVELIVKAGCAMNPVTTSGKTPLKIAFELQQPSVVRYLIDHGASVEFLNNLTQTQIEWASSDPWYLKLQDVLNSNGREPLHLTDKQVLQTAEYLSTKLPLRIVPRILDMAEYWVVNVVKREEFKKYDRRNKGKDDDYLSIVIKGTVKRIVFETISHDQGYSDFDYFQGTYWNSWTWFEAGHSGSPHRKTIQVNVHASNKDHLHTNIWDYRDPEFGPWLTQLHEGCTVTVYARADFPGWVNFVKKVQITVYSSFI